MTFEIRRTPPARAWRGLAAVGALLVGGLLMIGAATGAAATQDLDSSGQLYAVFIGGLGAVALLLGSAGIGDARRMASDRPVVLLLDATGVWMRTGSLLDDTAAAVGWDDVVGVEVGRAELTEDLFPAGGAGTYSTLRFVTTTDARIEADPLTAYDRLKAVALGLAPEEAQLCMIIGAATEHRIPQLRGYLASARPGLPFVDARSVGSDDPAS